MDENTLPGNLGATVTDIRGSMYYVMVTYDNGYAIKISGELFPGARFVAYKSAIRKWEAPHDDELVTPEMVAKVIEDVTAENGPGKVEIAFD